MYPDNYFIRRYLYCSSLIVWLVWTIGCVSAPKKQIPSIASGKYYQALGQHEDAIDFFREFITKESLFNPEAQYLIGESYGNLGDQASAEAAYNQVLIKYPTSPYAALALRRLGGIYRQRGEYKQAIKKYAKAIEVLKTDPNEEWCTFTIAQVYHYDLKDYAAALAGYNSLINKKELKNPRFASRSYLNIARIYVEQKRYSEAEKTYKLIMEDYSWSSQAEAAKAEIRKLKNQGAGN